SSINRIIFKGLKNISNCLSAVTATLVTTGRWYRYKRSDCYAQDTKCAKKDIVAAGCRCSQLTYYYAVTGSV
ncbi:MAG: hypothetical protein U9N19_09640, partial [Thermodesulfobacteriota bacterium]|nr:hypothetical protein [Thermodesulfobacteriota bacterium]